MSNVKILNPVEGETNEQRIKRCANNLLKAVLAAGYDVRSTSGLSGIDLNIYNHTGDMYVQNSLCHWEVNCGKPSVKVGFANMFTPKFDASETVEEVAK